MSERLIEYYADYPELERLTRRSGLLEAARTQELLARYLEAPAKLLDVGGGGGLYAAWLAGRGHTVRLLDPVPLHVEAARRLAGRPASFEARIGDARRLAEESASYDGVLMLGPLYHLTAREDRLAALREARRVCKPGGLVFAAAISRLAPALDGISKGWIADEHKLETVRRQMTDGTSLDHEPGFPSISYFHTSDELADEARDAGLNVQGVFGIEGPAWFLPEIEVLWADLVMRERVLWLARTVETQPAGLETSAHLLLVATV